ncbi:uncharacterized protein LOC105697607 isoform X2 [Orussus abietinus]|uniref:uncharacterized protein LOC105697607 isoform X2 n=1 Tax=Orussus abietinus TaxID=222816 RepID=UPI000626344C|nr:uncharacterized protein LOC105697607 isoform X2 [Orussus abietinus]
MKNVHPLITATTSNPASRSTSLIEETDPIIRLRLDKPLHWDWELTTTADTFPVVQLLDKDGRLLVETTGRTAQRARGSFKDGLKTLEKFPKVETSSHVKVDVAPQGNRNMEGFSTKFGSCQFGYKPRKSRSEATVTSREGKDRRVKKRHSSGVEVAKSLEDEGSAQGNTLKRYSTGEYLRQQIVDGLRSGSIGRSPEEIAEERCRRVKVYLRSQSEVASLSRDEDDGGAEEVGEKRARRENDQVDGKGRTRREDLEQIKKFLRERIKESMVREKLRSSGSQPVIGAEKAKKRLKEIQEKYSEDDGHFRRPRKARSEASIGVDPEINQGEETRNDLRESNSKIYDETYVKVQHKSENDILEEGAIEGRSRSHGFQLPGNSERAKEKLKEIRKRYSEQTRSIRDTHRPRKVRSEASIRFDPEVDERERSKTGLRKHESSGFAEASSRSRRGSRGEVLEEPPSPGQRVVKRSSTGSDRRKVYRKTKSDVLLSHMESSLDSEMDSRGTPRRIKSQENLERSWKEYKQRKKYERLHKDGEAAVAEEDFMVKPRWKDFQNDSCPVRNCKVCQNRMNCTNPLELPPSAKETIHQDVREPREQTNDVPPKNSIISKLRVDGCKAEEEDLKPLSLDCGYNSVSKNPEKDFNELYAHSNVKKSDTFKIVDGSEDVEDPCDRSGDPKTVLNDDLSSSQETSWFLTDQTNEDITKDYFKRVYELLKRRQEEARKIAEGRNSVICDDTSSSTYPEDEQPKRRRRRKKDNSPQGKEAVAVGPAAGVHDNWTVQRVLVANDSTSPRFRRPQLQAVAGTKRLRPPAPAPPAACRVNAKDISKYFSSPNKENRPHHGVNESILIEDAEARPEEDMGSNLSRHNGKGLTGRRTQSSGNLCDPKGKLNTVGKILVPCSSSQKERYKLCGSLPNHLDDKDGMDEDPGENNNVIQDTIGGSLGGTLPHKKRSLGVHFSDDGPTGALDLVKHRSQDDFDDQDPWRYQQSSDLDLVRCKHGNFDLVTRNQNTATLDSNSSKKYSRCQSVDERCRRSSDLDLVGTLPKRNPNAKGNTKVLETNFHQQCNVNDIDEDLLLKLVHKPDCELVKHRQLNKCLDLKLSKLGGGEPQDQGYASERSPEDEHPPSLPGQPFPNITPENTFRVVLQKSSRGLGLSVSGGGTAGPVRVKRLFPQQPAALSNKLQPGDILLAANGIPLTGLTNYGALEVLRTTSNTVELVVCRLPGETSVTPPGVPPPPPVRSEPPPPLRILNPLPPLQIEPCGEFDIEMTKVAGSLGFTLRKADSSALGHYVRALVREPALSDGRIQPGDKIVAVDGAPLSPMSHEEAVALLRQCGPKVKLRLYRDLAQTPVSALSPTEPDHPLRPPRTCLRQEAVDMLCDLAVRKLSPGTSSGSSCKQSPGTSGSSPRRLRRPPTRTSTVEDEQDPNQKYYVTQVSTTSQADTSDSDQCSIKTQITNSQPNTPANDIIDPPPLYDVCDSSDSKPSRPNFLDLAAPQDKPHFQFSLDSDSECTGPVIITESDSNFGTEAEGEDLARDAPGLSSDEQDTNLPSEPASMPPLLPSTNPASTAFSYKNPAYQSANPACGVADNSAKNKNTHSSDQDIPGWFGLELPPRCCDSL